MLWNPSNTVNAVQLLSLEVRRSDELDGAFNRA